MLKYTGHADFQKMEISIYGDGYSKDISIDLSKAPFGLKWAGFYPKNVIISEASALEKAITLTGDNLIIAFLEAPPEVDFSKQTITESPAGRVQLTLYFVYGTGVAE